MPRWSLSKSHHPFPLFKIIIAADFLRDDSIIAVQKPLSVFSTFQYHGMTSSGISAPLLSPIKPRRQRTRVKTGACASWKSGVSHIWILRNQVIAQSLLLPFLSWHTARRGRAGDSRSEFSRVSALGTVPACLAISPEEGPEPSNSAFIAWTLLCQSSALQPEKKASDNKIKFFYFFRQNLKLELK